VTSNSGIAFDRAGPTGRAPIVLVHAGIADRRMWQPQWAALSSSRDTIRVDLRGFGDSTTPPAGPLSHVQDVIETMDQLGAAGCHLVGASLGAGVAVEVALMRPELVRSLLLCPPGGSLLAELTPDLQRFIDAEDAALEREDLAAAVEANINAWVVGNGRGEGDVQAGVLAAVRTMQRHAFEVTAAWGDVAEGEIDPPAVERLGQLAVPTMVLIGGHDLDTTHDAAARICSGAPAARRVDWPDVAHLPSMERPTEFLALLREWVAGHE
jgi:pimeloyl-ACP methyl ester carboxylesterase